MMKKILKFTLLMAVILFLGGVGGMLFDEYVIPRLSSYAVFANTSLFKKLNDRVTIINKTEQVMVREDEPVEKVVSQPATAVMTVVASDRVLKHAETMTGVLLTNDGLLAVYSAKPADTKKNQYQALSFDGVSHQMDFVGRDSLTNIDFFRLSGATNTSAIAFANSDDARVGRKFVVVGNAVGDYQSRVAVGALGGIDHTFNLSGKTVASSEKWEGVFTLDVSDVERFVGSPVIDFNGEMEGLVGTLMIDNSVQSFALPANAVRESMERVIRGSLEQRPNLGVYYLSITKVLALEQELPRDHGALVYAPSGKTGLSVIEGSPAARAGLQYGDIIVSLSGVEITLNMPLSEVLTRFNAGDQIELVVIRGGEEKKISVQL